MSGTPSGGRVRHLSPVRQAEQLLEASGLPYVLLRPGRLTDGPYTSYDLNTLLQATAGSRQDVQLTAAETQNGEASRIAVAGLDVRQGALGTPSVHPYHLLASRHVHIRRRAEHSIQNCIWQTDCRAHYPSCRGHAAAAVSRRCRGQEVFSGQHGRGWPGSGCSCMAAVVFVSLLMMFKKMHVALPLASDAIGGLGAGAAAFGDDVLTHNLEVE